MTERLSVMARIADVMREPVSGLKRAESCALIIFGASGDLTRRKLMPALFHLLKIIDWDPADVAFDFGAEGRDVAAEIGIIRGLPDTGADPRVPPGDEQRHNNTGEQQDCGGDRDSAEQPKYSPAPTGGATRQ